MENLFVTVVPGKKRRFLIPLFFLIIEIPVLMISGRYDAVIPFTHAEAALQNIESASKPHVIFNRSSHSPFMSAPEKFADVVSSFIDNL